MKRIFLYEFERSFLIFLLLSKILEEKLIIVVEDLAKNENNKYSKKFYKMKNVRLEILNSKKLYSNLIERIIYIRVIRKKLKFLIQEINNNEALLYGGTCFKLGSEVFFKEKIIEIEEGAANYTITEEKILKEKLGLKQNIREIIKRLVGLKTKKGRLGYAENTTKIYLTENLCKEIPKGLEKKAEIINLKELWNKKSEEEKKIILNVFDFNSEILKRVDESTVMLFTQPLSEDNVISEEIKIELYSKILKKYENQSVIIKPHPREKTDYSIYFSNCYVMKEKYPVEILELVGINIKKAVTIFSSAAFAFGKNVDIDFYGTEVHPKLLRIFGSQDNIMKRNAFLD